MNVTLTFIDLFLIIVNCSAVVLYKATLRSVSFQRQVFGSEHSKQNVDCCY